MDADGEIRAAGAAPLSLETPQPGWAEQDPEDWWDASCAAIRDVIAKQPKARVEAVGISGQMHSSVFLDKAGAVIRPALLWSDGRTTAECREIEARAGGESKLRDWVCNPALEGFTLPKVLWLRNHEPDAFSRLSKVLLAKDFVRLKLTGALATEPSDASGTLMFDPAHLRWSAEMLSAMDLSPSLLPDVGGSSAILGKVNEQGAKLSRLPVGTPVVGGGADNACGAAGVGAVTPGDAVSSWGTSGTVLAPIAAPRVDPKLRAHTFCHVAPGVWYLMGVVLSAGGAFAWYRDQLARDLPERSRDDTLIDEAAATPPGADGVTFLPYLQGERTPHRDSSLRAAFVGLSLAHSRGHMTRAVVEGVCFALRDSLEILRELGLVPEHLLLTGGGAKNSFIRQVQADIFGLPVATVNREEGGAYGAALLAALGAGAFPDLQTAVQRTLTRRPSATPNPETHKAYEHIYARFKSRLLVARA